MDPRLIVLSPLPVLLIMIQLGGCARTRDSNSPVAAHPPVEVLITGDDFNWRITYPGADSTLGTPDDITVLQDLHVPTNAVIHLELRSHDYLYTIAIPHFNVKEIAVPDLEFSLDFHSADAGVFELRGDQMCGYSHESLLGQLIVQPPDEFMAWLSQVESTPRKKGTST